MNYYKKKKLYNKELYKQIVSNTTHNTITEIPKDYKKPIGFHHDFGLLLNKEGIKNILYVSMETTPMGMVIWNSHLQWEKTQMIM